jgi:hypothetical protein
VLVGIPKEVKNNEFRVSTTPAGVHALALAGHTVFVEKGAGVGSAITDAEYLIHNNMRENDEFYIAPIYNISISRGLKVQKYLIKNDEFWSVGTPEDLSRFLQDFKLDI